MRAALRGGPFLLSHRFYTLKALFLFPASDTVAAIP